jgi:membrane-associated protease RseP (regulator of RpoE activity)
MPDIPKSPLNEFEPLVQTHPVTLFEPKYRPKYKLSLLLFVITVISTLLVGAEYNYYYRINGPSDEVISSLGRLMKQPSMLLGGFPFTLTLLGFLMAHEMGHYLACQYYGIRATLPYFIPFPNLIGTLGAFIRIRSPFENRKALFDVGIAGPIAGFVVAVPALIMSLPFSKVTPMKPGFSYFLFGESLMFKFVARIFGLHFQAGMDINYHPVAFAALVGFFATALNLLPVGQLDGGHIVYAMFGRRHHLISRLFVFGAIPVLMFFWTAWLMWAVIPLILGINHPPTLDDEAPLGTTRKAVAVLGLIIFLLSFSPTPIRLI